MTTRNCVACGYNKTEEIFHPNDMPLSVMTLPKSETEAVNMKRLPMNFHCCLRCGHVYNVAFDYHEVPYSDNSNLMYNHGSGWQDYIDVLIDELQESYDLNNKTIIEIGCGSGHFLHAIKEEAPKANVIGFEPGTDSKNLVFDDIQVIGDYFSAEVDILKYKPDFILCRHVLEHFQDPRDFISDISFWCNKHQIYPFFLGEVPRIDKSFSKGRVNDYIYEHASNFTSKSFDTMFEYSGFKKIWSKPVYDDEVIVGLFQPEKDEHQHQLISESIRHQQDVTTQFENITNFLLQEKKSGKTIAFWGGTGKGAAFLNFFNIQCNDFPLVIDSDPLKENFFVPGTGQKIQLPNVLQENPVDIIVITTPWRAQDIFDEIKQKNIQAESVYTQDKLKLINIQNVELCK